MGGGGTPSGKSTPHTTTIKVPYDVLKKRAWSDYMSKNMVEWNPFTDAVRSTLHSIAEDPQNDIDEKLALLTAQTKKVIENSHTIHDEYMHKLTKGFIVSECDSLGIDLLKILNDANQAKESKRAEVNAKRKATKKRTGK